MTVQSIKMPTGNSKLIRAFRDLAESFSELVAPDYDVKPFDGDYPQNFAMLNATRQKEVLTQLGCSMDLFAEVRAAGQPLTDDSVILWRVLGKMRLRPTDDLFENLTGNDLIEIYDQENIQVFRNFYFFNVCSYTLDDVVCRPWWELFRRDMSIINHIMKAAENIYRQNKRETVPLALGIHTVDEISSVRRYHAVVENKVLSPLVDSFGKVSAIVNVVRVHSCQSGIETPISNITSEGCENETNRS